MRQPYGKIPFLVPAARNLIMWQRALARRGFPLFAMPWGLVEVPPPDVGGMVGADGFFL
jgi:hypothetical protein